MIPTKMFSVYKDEGFPCENCITFPICKAQMINSNYMSILILASKCSLIKKYIYSDVTTDSDLIIPQYKLEYIRLYFQHYGEENDSV